jgi:serine/threonine protein kinase
MNTPDLFEKIDVLQFKCKLGAGGYGTVFKAFATDLDHDVAVKFANDARRGKRFGQEASLMKTLQNSKGFPDMYEYASTRQYTYISMQLCGRSL